MKHVFIFLLLSMCLHVHGVSDVKVSVMEEDSVTLNTGVQTNQQYSIIWYFNNTLIAQITGDQSKICTDIQCKERFRDRLKLDDQTGSLTLMNIRNTDSGEYTLKINSSSSTSEKTFSVSVHGVSDPDKVSVVGGDSVTLNTGVQMNQQHKIKWYFNGIHIAVISGDLSYICTDVQCDKRNERFRGRLKLDHQTGSLTIMNTRNTDYGEHTLVIISSSSYSVKIFRVYVYDVSPVERDKKKRKSVKEGESVTLDSGVIKSSNDSMRWYFNDTLIAEITGDQSKICTDVQCDERFRDRLKLDHQTGSLTLTNITNTDSGEYKLLIISSSRFSIIRSFSVSVTDSDLSPAVVAGICVAVLLIVAGLIYCCQSRRNGIRTKRNDQANGVEDSSSG
ncbi:uncharacterized protein LOC125263378 isoform X2 [Megalobrama amblycephala]|uniref:uncharacterized protein LOC125263378 isoform X2 n=1 Tax=Megalobrama amblycephala TaxID=75352 RepID=UPI0020145CCF|nr:uncharacterized protein LOC125263378 isoform X2 [Megalobrama amblycephala]